MTKFRMAVDKAFRFRDGSTVFIGRVTSGSLSIPSSARLLQRGRVVAVILLSEERMPGPNSAGTRTVVTRDSLEQAILFAGDLLLEGPEPSLPKNP